MKISIIGSGSFLSGYIIKELTDRKLFLNLFGIKQDAFSGHNFNYFCVPDSPLDFNNLLDSDVIVYSAGAGIQANLKESKELIFELNSFLPIKLANFLVFKNFSGKFISFGSFFEIGNNKEMIFYTEEMIAQSLNRAPTDYVVSKRLLTKFFSSCLGNLKYFHLILPVIYGKGENQNRLIPYLIKRIRDKTDIKLTKCQQTRQYIHASDVASLISNICFQEYLPGIYNVSNREPVLVKNLVKTIFNVLNYNIFSDSIFGKETREDTNMKYLLMDNAKISSTFKDWTPKMSLEEGVLTYIK